MIKKVIKRNCALSPVENVINDESIALHIDFVSKIKQKIDNFYHP